MNSNFIAQFYRYKDLNIEEPYPAQPSEYKTHMENDGERDDDALDIQLAKAKVTSGDIKSTNTISSQNIIPGEDPTEMDDPKRDACNEGDYALIIEDRMRIPLQLTNGEPGEPGNLNEKKHSPTHPSGYKTHMEKNGEKDDDLLDAPLSKAENTSVDIQPTYTFPSIRVFWKRSQ